MPLDVLDLAEKRNCEEILALEEAIRRLEQRTPEIAAVTRLRFYAGLTVAQLAEKAVDRSAIRRSGVRTGLAVPGVVRRWRRLK